MNRTLDYPISEKETGGQPAARKVLIHVAELENFKKGEPGDEREAKQ